jgi:hypothetical protein
VATRISRSIDADLEDGAADVTAAYRPDRLVEHEGSSYLLPTIVRCDTPEHRLANREFLFPYASVVEADTETLLAHMGPTLVLTAITGDRALIRRLLASPRIDRINVGPIPTPHIRWDQPHEGNLFDHLYSRRAFQSADLRHADGDTLSVSA